MSYSRPFLVNGVEIPTPSTCKFSIEDLSSEATGRTLDGMMHKDVVAVKLTLDCTWADLSWGESAHLLSAVDGKPSFQLTYPDPREPTVWRTGAFYTGKRCGSARNLRQDSGYWSDISLSFIQI